MNLKALTLSSCVFCGIRAVYDNIPICSDCMPILQEILDQKCRTCGNVPKECVCGKTKRIPFLFFYDSLDSRRLLYGIKMKFDRPSMDFVSEMLVRFLEIDVSRFDGVTYVPRWRGNIAKYGYDQSKALAKSISRIFGIPFLNALKRTYGGDQKLLSYSQRRIKTRDKFRLRYVPERQFKRILLVDDIITTGATIEICADIIRRGFAETVKTVVVAKNNRPK